MSWKQLFHLLLLRIIYQVTSNIIQMKELVKFINIVSLLIYTVVEKKSTVDENAFYRRWLGKTYISIM